MAGQKYFINGGRKAVFNHQENKSVGQMEPTYETVIAELAKPDDVNSFNSPKFEHMFNKTI